MYVCFKCSGNTTAENVRMIESRAPAFNSAIQTRLIEVARSLQHIQKLPVLPFC